MNTMQALIESAHQQGASDLHLEPGMPVAIRVRGALRALREPVPGAILLEMAKETIGADHWPQFLARQSADFSATVGGVRCRFNVLHTSRGVGFVVRLLSGFQPTLERLNLHPDLKKLAAATNGLVLVSGATGSGKSSTLGALIQEINLTESRHIITLESPIEYVLRPRKAFIRQREVGRDTPSFEQGLIDALREDPDVLMVGEMREPETMRLTINAAETGHLVMATVHSGTCAEALQRIVLAFPSEIQNHIAVQLADSLVGVVCQRLRFRADLGIRVPECEILRSTSPVKTFIRNREFFKLTQALETGAESGMWTFERYQTWMSKRTQWHISDSADETPDREDDPVKPASLPDSSPTVATATKKPSSISTPEGKPSGGPIEIEPVEGGLEELIKRLR